MGRQKMIAEKDWKNVFESDKECLEGLQQLPWNLP